MKKLISILCAAMLAVSPILAYAADGSYMIQLEDAAGEKTDINALTLTPDSGECGDRLKWELKEDGTLTISGKGKMRDYTNNTADIPWMRKNDRRVIKKITVESGVTSISGAAFYGTSITELTLPDTVEAVGQSFAADCHELTFVSLPDSIRSIPEKAFVQDIKLETVNLPQKLDSIEKNAFINCPKLKNIILPQELSKIGESAFASCALETVVIPKEVKTVEDGAFSGCSELRELIFQKGCEEIGKCAFLGCDSLKEIILPDGLKKIDSYAFSTDAFSTDASEKDGSLPKLEIYVPKTVKTIEKSGIGENAVIYGFINSAAEKYAKNNKLEFEAVTESLFEADDRGDITEAYYSRKFPAAETVKPSPEATVNPAVSEWGINKKAPVFADIDDTDKSVILSRLGIVTGYEDGKFHPEAELTRAEAAAIISRMSNSKEDIENFEYNMSREGSSYSSVNTLKGFSDYSPSHWANTYIGLGIEQGFIEGFDDNTFRPEEKVTMTQLIKMLVCAAGYDYYAQMMGGYPAGYLLRAKKLGITEGIEEIHTDRNASRGEMLTCVGNAIDIPICVIVGYETGSYGTLEAVYETKAGQGADYETLLSYIHKIYTTEANVLENAASIKAEIISSRNFDGKEIQQNNKLSVELKTNFQSAGDITSNGKYKLFIKVKDSDEKDYELIYGTAE